MAVSFCKNLELTSCKQIISKTIVSFLTYKFNILLPNAIREGVTKCVTVRYLGRRAVQNDEDLCYVIDV